MAINLFHWLVDMLERHPVADSPPAGPVDDGRPLAHLVGAIATGGCRQI